MKIALFSDIYPDLPALMTFFKDPELDAVYWLGVLVVYNILLNAVIYEIRNSGIAALKEITFNKIHTL